MTSAPAVLHVRDDATGPVEALKKRAEGLIDIQALLALARRRVDVLRAMLRDRRPFASAPPVAQTA